MMNEILDVFLCESVQFEDTTGIPYFDSMLEKPDYFRKNKNATFQIVQMTPRHYFDLCAEGFWQQSGNLRKEFGQSLRAYKNFLLSWKRRNIEKDWDPTRRMYMPVLEYSKNMFSNTPKAIGFEQEGLHRAVYCMKEDVKEIPVMVVFREIDENEVMQKMGIKEGTDFKSRLGQCYVLSGRYVLNHPDAVLVHGSINGKRWTGKDFDNPHAWVEEDGMVFDPVLDQRFPIEVYREVFGAKEMKRYTSEEMMILMVKRKNWGSWE